MDEETALTPLATADNTDLTPEVRAELQALALGARETIRKAWSPHTHRAYAGAWRRFDKWTALHGLESLPALPATILLYLQGLEEQGLAPSTIRTAVSAVAATHRAAGASRSSSPPGPWTCRRNCCHTPEHGIPRHTRTVLHRQVGMEPTGTNAEGNPTWNPRKCSTSPATSLRAEPPAGEGENRTEESPQSTLLSVVLSLSASTGALSTAVRDSSRAPQPATTTGIPVAA